MTLKTDDLFLVNRGGNSFKTEYELIKQNILIGAGGATVSETPPSDPHEGEFWYHPGTDELSIWVTDEVTGVVTGVGVRGSGSGYNSSATNVATTGGSGSELTVDIQAGVGGTVVNPTVNQGGHGYKTGDIVFITGTGHGNASLSITSVNVVALGAWESVGSYWDRTGTTLSPSNAGDSVDIGSGSITLNSNGVAQFGGGGSSTNSGVTILAGGTIRASKDRGLDSGLEIYEVGTTDPKITLKANGEIITTADAIINSVTVGRGSGNVLTNTAAGFEALSSNTTGSNNAALGYGALRDNTEGRSNTAIGYASLYFNITGLNNTATGASALQRNISGNTNTATGATALFYNTTGTQNTAIGATALFNNTEANENTAIGDEALYTNTTGSGNTALGFDAGYFIEGSNNTILGPYRGTAADATLSDTVIISAGTTERLRIDDTGLAMFAGKVTSASTEETDSDTTLVTKDYVDANGGGGGSAAWGDIASGGAINASLNIANVTTNGSGYVVTFTTPMPTANYAISSTAKVGPNTSHNYAVEVHSQTTTGFQVYLRRSDGAAGPNPGFSFSVHANTGTIVGDNSPPGSVIMFAGVTPPTGWLECNGQTAPSALAAVLGQANVPDLRGEFVRGWDNARGIDAGRNLLTTQDEAFKEHKHSTTAESRIGNTGAISHPAGWSRQDTPTEEATFDTDEVGGTETRPRNVALMYIIKT